jgi:hypothetical protein
VASTVSKAVREWRNQAGVIERKSGPSHQARTLKMSRRMRPTAAVPLRAMIAEVALVAKMEKPNSSYGMIWA